MIKFMKFEVITYYILKVLGYFCGIIGAFGLLGYAGSLSCGIITAGQFVVYELGSFGLMGLAVVFYAVRELIVEDFIERDRRLHRIARYRVASARNNYNK